MVSLDVCIELPEIARWHILAYFIHISNAWLTGLKSPNVNQEQNRGLGVLVPEQRMNHHCWQSVLGQCCPSRGFEWPSLFLVSAPLTSTRSPSHEHIPKETRLTLEAPRNRFWLEGMWIRRGVFWSLQADAGACERDSKCHPFLSVSSERFIFSLLLPSVFLTAANVTARGI